ncbi:MAG: terminase small subunit [Agathobaculum desmolans]|uniref:terminase small subunit n=1 Tax=Agathobaculum desmolans TaxID=39484 RepID=UPI003994E361
MGKLTVKQQAWIDFYKQGKTAAEAARLAGYKGDNLNVIGAQNLTKLSNYIAERDKLLETPRIADMEEINEFWTSVMRDKREETKDRLKASELRAKAAGAFVQQMQVSGVVPVQIIDDIPEDGGG